MIIETPPAIVSALVYTSILYHSVGLRAGSAEFFFFALVTLIDLLVSMLVGCVHAACARLR